MERRCTCTHGAALHGYGRRNGQVVRIDCSASTCDCQRYVPGEPDNHCPTCGTTWSPIEAARREGS